MSQQTSLEQSYLVLLNFLMLSKRRVFELGAESGLTGMQAMMLFMLDHPRPMHNFKKVFNCDASNITGLVDGLEQKQLASRYEDQADRRIKMVKLEPKGKRARTTLLRNLSAHGSPLLSKLNPAELQTFIALLEKITTGEQHV
jgi:DNA-binding MarR family transcriptional regulator